MTRMGRLGQTFRKEVLAVCAVAFLADVVSGIVSPTFSLYAESLGASLALIGVLTSLDGLTRIIASVPIGSLSDSKGRKNVLLLGLLLFTISSILYSIAPNAYWLFPIRVLGGLAGICTWFIGVAHLGDIVAKKDRGLVIGVYTTCMGLGFTVGPAIGGALAANYGYTAGFRVAAAAAFLGVIIVYRGVSGRVAAPREGAPSSPLPLGAKLSLMVKEPNLLAASLGNFLSSGVFSTVFGFFSLYAASLAIGKDSIGYMFATRAFMSAAGRLPTGMLTTRVSARLIMLSSLGMTMIMVLAISSTNSPALLTVFLAGEGFAYGTFLTSGQAFVTEHSTESNRGTAMAVYTTAGSLSSIGPFVLGGIAAVWGLTVVFQVVGVVVFLGIGVLIFMGVQQHRAVLATAKDRAS